MNTQRGWKVVAKTRYGDRRVSILQDGRGEVEYSGEWSIPSAGFGPLCVFATRQHADEFIKWANLPRRHELLECEYVSSAQQRVYDEWGSTPIWRLPPGTVLADRVRLIL